MSDLELTSVEIELQAGEPLRGSISAGTDSLPFVGWIELAQALDAVRSGEWAQHPEPVE